MAKNSHSTSRAGGKNKERQSKGRKPRDDAGAEQTHKLQTALFEIADAASAMTDMQSFYRRIHKIVGKLMYAENFFIALHDPQTDLITWPYYVDTVDIEQPEPITLKEQHGGTGWILRTGRTLSHAEGTVSHIIEDGEAEQTGTVSDAIGVPLKSDGKTVGVLLIQSYRDDIRYNLKNVEVMNFVAQHISIALTRARAIEETRQRNAELAILNSVGEAMAKTLDVRTVTRIVGDKVRDIFSADQVGILLLERQTNMLHLLYGYDKANDRYLDDRQIDPIPLGKGLTSKVIESRQPLLFGTQEEKEGYGHYMPPELVGQIKLCESWLGVPIMVADDVLGAALVEDYRPHAYNEDHLRLLQTLSSNMGVAIQNARLFDELQQRNQEITEALEQQTATSEILSVIASSRTDLKPVLDTIAERAAKICDAGACQIRLVEGNHLVVASNFGDDRLFPVGSIVRISRETVSGRAVIDREMIHIPDLLEVFDEYPLIANMTLKAGDRTWLVTPLLREGVAIGTIHIRRFQVRLFTEKQMTQLKVFADQAVIAIESVRLLTETQRLLKETEDRAAELAVINSVQEGLASKLEMQAIYDLVGDKIMEIFEADVVGIGFYDPALKALDHPYIVDHGERFFPPPMPVPDELVKYLKTHDATLINTYQEAQALMERFGIHNIGGPTPDNSYIVVPLMISGEFMGRITVAKLPAFAFNPSDVRLLQTLVNSMSVALENARLWEQEKMFRKALQRELEIGREIQAGFLPDSLPQVEGWEIAASLMSAREVAGDFYDVFNLPDGNIGLVIADVCDKGVGAALFMTLFRSLIRAVANLDYFEHTETTVYHSTEERLQRAISLANNYIAETHGKSGMFATLFFGILDPRTGCFTYINGGHESPFILSTDNSIHTLYNTGPAVGVIPSYKFEILETQLKSGDILFAYTDGVPDCQNLHGEFFGRNRLNDLLLGSVSAQKAIDVVVSSLQRYIGGANQFDDITLLAVRRD